EGRTRSDGAVCWRVSSASTAGLYHMVCLTHDQLLCSCPAGERPGRLCMHRALVLSQLLARTLRGTAGERQVVAVPLPKVPLGMGRVVGSAAAAHLSPRGMRRLAAAVVRPPDPAVAGAAQDPACAQCPPCETTLAEDERDTTLLRRSQRPFS